MSGSTGVAGNTVTGERRHRGARSGVHYAGPGARHRVRHLGRCTCEVGGKGDRERKSACGVANSPCAPSRVPRDAELTERQVAHSTRRHPHLVAHGDRHDGGGIGDALDCLRNPPERSPAPAPRRRQPSTSTPCNYLSRKSLLSACRNLPCESVRLSPAAGGNQTIRPLPPPGVDYRSASVTGLLDPCGESGTRPCQHRRIACRANNLRPSCRLFAWRRGHRIRREIGAGARGCYTSGKWLHDNKLRITKAGLGDGCVGPSECCRFHQTHTPSSRISGLSGTECPDSRVRWALGEPSAPYLISKPSGIVRRNSEYETPSARVSGSRAW